MNRGFIFWGVIGLIVLFAIIVIVYFMNHFGLLDFSRPLSVFSDKVAVGAPGGGGFG